MIVRILFSLLIALCLFSSCKKEEEEKEPEATPPFVPCEASLTDNQFQWDGIIREITSLQCNATYIQGMASTGQAIVELGEAIDSTIRLEITPSNPDVGEASLVIQTDFSAQSQRATSGFLYAEVLDSGAIRYSWCDLECIPQPGPASPPPIIVSGRIICE